MDLSATAVTSAKRDDYDEITRNKQAGVLLPPKELSTEITDGKKVVLDEQYRPRPVLTNPSIVSVFLEEIWTI